MVFQTYTISYLIIALGSKKEYACDYIDIFSVKPHLRFTGSGDRNQQVALLEYVLD